MRGHHMTSQCITWHHTTQEIASHKIKTHQITSHDMIWHLATNHITSPHVTSQPTALLHRSLQPTTSKQVTTSPHQITSHDMTWRLATNHIHSPTTKCRISPGNQPHQNRSTHHNHGTVWASQSLVTLYTFYRQFFFLLIVFFLETSAPGLPGSTCTGVILCSTG